MISGRCETCGNKYNKMLEVRINGRAHLFDCFECAVHALAPRCEHCSVPVIGHGVEAASHIYCCASCARAEGDHVLRDSA